MRTCLAGAALLLAVGCSSGPGSDAGAARSLLLVTLDTTRADHLEPYGGRGVETPHLAGLARDGAVFEHAYAATPVTLPSHATMLTGLDPTAHGVRNNGIHHLRPEATTLAELLAAEGFATAAFVSAAVLDHRYGLDQGFGVYGDDLAGGKPKELRMIAERGAGATVAAARAWLDARPDDGRFLLWVHLFDPHLPYEPPDPWRERYRDHPYDGEIAYMDSELGRLLTHPRLGPREGVLVMVVGDHGESLGEHGEASHAMLLYDATLRIPWIVRRPGGRGGLRLPEPVAQVDLLPTCLDLLGLGAAARELPLAGVSRAASLRGEEMAPIERDLYAETFVPFYTYGWARLRALRRGGWKLIDGPRPELYDLSRDPEERENLFEREPERSAGLLGRLRRRVAEEASPEATVVPDPAAAEQLRSLGYLASRPTSPGPVPDRERPDPKAMIDLHRAMERAEHHLYARDFDRAVSELRAVLARDSTNLAALADLARALGETGRTEEALEAVRFALSLAPEQADLHLTLAGLLAAQGETRQAIAALAHALTLDPRSLDAQVEKARLLYRLGGEEENVEAQGLLARVLEQDPRHGRGNVLWAEEVELPAGRLAAAEDRLRRAVAREPFLAEGWRALGRVLEAAGRPEPAAEAYQEGLGHQPRDAGLHALLGILWVEQGEVERAEPHLRQALELSPEPLPEVHDAQAAAAATRGDWQGMEAAARRAVALEPAMASGWNHLAVALEETGRSTEALSAYQRALAADPGYWQARFNQGLLLRKLGRFREAAAAFEEVLGQLPGHTKSHYELGVLYGGALGRPDLARRHLRAALESEQDPSRASEIQRLLASLPAS